MNVIPQVPPGCQITGSIPDASDVRRLTGDLLDVYCPMTETLVSVGWYPEEDPQGEYSVTVYRHCEEIRSQSTRDAAEALNLVEAWCAEFQPTPQLQQF